MLFRSHIYYWLKQNDNDHIPPQTPIENVLGSAKNLTPSQGISIHKYKKSSEELNHSLIGGNTNKNQNEQAEHLDNAIENNKIEGSVHVYSGLGFDPTKHMNENGQLHSPAYISTSHDKFKAKGFATPVNGIHHIMHLYLPEGSPAMHIPEEPEHVSKESEKSEEEVLLRRGATLQHNGYRDYEDRGRKYRIHRMSLVLSDKE